MSEPKRNIYFPLFEARVTLIHQAGGGALGAELGGKQSEKKNRSRQSLKPLAGPQINSPSPTLQSSGGILEVMCHKLKPSKEVLRNGRGGRETPQNKQEVFQLSKVFEWLKDL